MSGILGVLIGNIGGVVAFSLTAGISSPKVGFSAGGAFGTINGSTAAFVLPSGTAIQQLYDQGASGTNIVISGFASDPGIGFLQSLTINGVTLRNATATYAFNTPSTGMATWGWTTNIGLSSGTTYPALVTGPAAA